MRIVSLLPSATEMVCELGLQDSLVGVSHECDYPVGVERLPRVTRSLIPHGIPSREIDELVREQLQTERALYHLQRELLDELRPDLIVTQSLCDVCAVSTTEVEAAVCSLPGGVQVLSLAPQRLEDMFADLKRLGAAAGVPEIAEQAIGRLRERVLLVAERSRGVTSRPWTLLLEWIDPPFSAGHWTPELIELAGGEAVLGAPGVPSRTLSWAEIAAANPEVLVIACCGFDLPRTERDLPVLGQVPELAGLNCLQNDRIYLADGNWYFNRPGPRLVDSLELLAHALHPELHPVPPGMTPFRLVTQAELSGA